MPADLFQFRWHKNINRTNVLLMCILIFRLQFPFNDKFVWIYFFFGTCEVYGIFSSLNQLYLHIYLLLESSLRRIIKKNLFR